MLAAMRNVERILTSHRQLEGGGFVVRRPFPSATVSLVDPFLLLDELGPIDYAPGEAVGAPDHPHRGFETVSYILEGELEHEDSAGHRGELRAGDVQWMTAGAGIVHSEMPSRALRERGGRVHGFQIWVNLPARLKLTTPRYQEIPASRIPTAEHGGARVRVIAGEALGVRAVIETHTPIVFHHWSLDRDAQATVPLAPDQRGLVYVFGGELEIAGRRIVDGQLAILPEGTGDAIAMRASAASEALVLAGVPLGEPVARYGPFVMNNEREIMQAIRDYQTGRMGEITRSAQIG
jgi:redox-sensitive bicupin YhaK (pirin superfamily)